MRLIDADALLPMMKYATTDSEIGVFPIKIGFNAIAKVIDDMPAVDAVPVIRCRDCIRWRQSKSDTAAKVCDWDRYEKTEKDYCSWAKRREDD